MGEATGVLLTSEDGSTHSLVSGIERLPYGPISRMRFGNGIEYAASHNTSFQLIEQSYGPNIHRHYRYGAAGNVTDIFSDAPASDRGDQAYDYDRLDRLTRETGVYGHQEYAYDANGNRVSRRKVDIQVDASGIETSVGQTFGYDYEPGSNRLAALSRTGDQTNYFLLSYDKMGNFTHEDEEYRYNDAGQLASVYEDGFLRGKYYYNERGERAVEEEYDGETLKATISNSYDEQGNLLAVRRRNAAGLLEVDESFVWLDSMPVARMLRKYHDDGSIKSDEIVYLHVDHLNTPRWATDAQGEIVWFWNSDAFGEGEPETDPDGDGHKVHIPLRFSGQVVSEGGLYYNYYLDYDPSTGRYIQSDPIGLEG